MSELPAHDRSFRQNLACAVRPVDILVLCAVPVGLLGIFALPQSIRLQLVFSHRDPTLLTAYTSHFVHLTSGHLLANLLLYLFVTPTVYCLCVLAGRRQLFWTAFVVCLGGFPLILSAMNLALWRTRPVVELGFSGIVMALFGLLPLALAAYAGEVFDDDLTAVSSPPLFFFVTALIAFFAVPLTPASIAAGVLSIAAAGLYGQFVGGTISLPGLSDVRKVVRKTGYFELTAVAVLLLVVLPVVSFRVTAHGNSLTNGYLHFQGFALGYIAAYVTSLAETGGFLFVPQ